MAEREHPFDLAWYVAGSLTSDEARRVEAHVESCDECRTEVQLLESMRDGLQATRPPEHLSPEDLVALSEDRVADLSEEREGVLRHLAECDSCREELDLLRAATEATAFDTDGAGGDTGRRNPWRTAFVAAAAVFVVAIVVTGITRRPADPTIQTVSSVVLAPPQRAEEPVPVLRGPGPWIVSIVLPYTAPSGRYRIAIRQEKETVAEHEVIEEKDGKLTLLVRRLRGSGEYELVVAPAADAGGATHDYPFHLDTSTEN